MPKIKTKKKVTARELIDSYLDGKIEGGKYINEEDNFVVFSDYSGSKMCQVGKKTNPDELFGEVVIWEKIDENTKLDNLVMVCNWRECLDFFDYDDPISIKEIIRIEGEHAHTIKAFYILQDDMTMQLIWKDGEFVV